MGGRGGNSRGRGGCGGRCGHGSSVHGRGSVYYTATLNKNKGLCSSLGNNILGWEKIVHRVGTIYGHSISKELHNKMKVFIPKPEYTEYVLPKQKYRVELLSFHSERISEASEAKKFMLNRAVEDGNDPEAPIKLAML